jgi:hypothetical protein
VSTQRDEIRRLRGMLGMPIDDDTPAGQMAAVVSQQHSRSKSLDAAAQNQQQQNQQNQQQLQAHQQQQQQRSQQQGQPAVQLMHPSRPTDNQRAVKMESGAPAPSSVSASSTAALAASLAGQGSPPARTGVATRRSSRRSNSPEDAPVSGRAGAAASASAVAGGSGGGGNGSGGAEPSSFASLALMGTPGPGSEPYVRDKLRTVYMAILSKRPVDSFLATVREARGTSEDGFVDLSVCFFFFFFFFFFFNFFLKIFFPP